MVSGFEKLLLAALLFVLMFGMGATLTGRDFKAVLNKPRGIIVGLLSQFGWMPLVAFGLVHLLSLDPIWGLSLIIVGTTPGGTTSNLFTYFSGANLALSISMTVVSTVVAVIAMPALLSAYAAGLSADGHVAIPLVSIISTLAIMLVPLALGMLLRARNPSAADRAEKAGSIAGIAVLIALVVTGVLRNSELFTTITVRGYIAVAALSIIGMILGYLAATVARLDRPSRVAVSLETGIQNTPLAMGVILLSFPDSLADRLLQLPLMYALFVLIIASVATAIFRATNSQQPVTRLDSAPHSR